MFRHCKYETQSKCYSVITHLSSFVNVCSRLLPNNVLYLLYLQEIILKFIFVNNIRIQMKNRQKPLTTKRLSLRNLNVNDYENLFIIRFHPEVLKHIQRDIIDDKTEFKTFIFDRLKEVENGKICFWGISELDSSKLIGTICLWNFNNEKTTAEVGYELHPNFHKKGLMSEAMNTVLDFGFNELHLKTIEAFTSKYNEGSKALLNKFNFKLDSNRKDKSFPNNIIYTKHYA